VRSSGVEAVVELVGTVGIEEVQARHIAFDEVLGLEHIRQSAVVYACRWHSLNPADMTADCIGAGAEFGQAADHSQMVMVPISLDLLRTSIWVAWLGVYGLVRVVPRAAKCRWTRCSLNGGDIYIRSGTVSDISDMVYDVVAPPAKSIDFPYLP
jgi:hypothetical protein